MLDRYPEDIVSEKWKAATTTVAFGEHHGTCITALLDNRTDERALSKNKRVLLKAASDHAEPPERYSGDGGHAWRPRTQGKAVLVFPKF